MTNWFFSDPHYDHKALLTGPKARPFKTVDEMQRRLVENHNALVRPRDSWYCLGDVSMGEDALVLLGELNGTGHLILGNHDVHPIRGVEIMGYKEMAGVMFSHMPIAPWSMRWRANVHGHCHAARPLVYKAVDPLGEGGADKRKVYLNLSLERTNYRPVTLEQILAFIEHADTY